MVQDHKYKEIWDAALMSNCCVGVRLTDNKHHLFAGIGTNEGPNVGANVGANVGG